MRDEGKRATTLIESTICSPHCLMPGHWLATDHTSPRACSFPGLAVDAGFVGEGTDGEKGWGGVCQNRRERKDSGDARLGGMGQGVGGRGWGARRCVDVVLCLRQARLSVARDPWDTVRNEASPGQTCDFGAPRRMMNAGSAPGEGCEKCWV